MAKRSRLRNDRRGKGWTIFYGVLAGCFLLLGLHFFLDIKFSDLGGFLQGSKRDGPKGLLDSRGAIFDRNFEELAVTLEKVSVYVNVKEVDAAEISGLLAPVLEMESIDIQGKIGMEPYKAWIKHGLTQKQEEGVEALEAKGVKIHKERMRYYPQKEVAAHLVGFVGKSMGLSGVEYRYNSLLAISEPQQHGGAETKPEEVSRTSTDRYLVLNVDLKIQKIIEEYLADLQIAQGGKGAAIVMESETGKIISAAGFPSYDPNHFREYGWNVVENILGEQVIIPQKLRSFFWQSSLIQAQSEKKLTPLPWATMSAVRRLGSQVQLWDRLGLNDPLNIDFIKDEPLPYLANLASFPDDYSRHYDSVTVKTTPMQIITAVNGLLQGGKSITPHAINRIVTATGKTIELAPQEDTETVTHDAAVEIQKLFAASGTEGPLNSSLLECESMSSVDKGKGFEIEKNSFLISTVPADSPKLMLFVFVKLPAISPNTAETKSTFILREGALKIIERVYTLEQVRSGLSELAGIQEKIDMNYLINQVNGDLSSFSVIDDAVILGTMPDVKGMSLRKSLRMLKDLKLEIQIVGSGVVVEQHPDAGQKVKPGSFCRLTLKPH